MPLFGAHMSIAGGYYKALRSAQEHGCETVQLFTKSSNQWRAKPFSDEDVATFQRVLKETGLRMPTAHDSYLINLASPDDTLYRKSIEAFAEEMQRAERLGLCYLVTHPGSPLDSGEEKGMLRIAKALDEVHQRYHGYEVQVLLENTAGQGSSLGYRFEHLAKIIDLVKDPDRLGICFDTCHAFAAGYPLSPEKGYRATMKTFDEVVGLKKLRIFHVNDSLKPLGSQVDRHASIGKGCLGLEPFRLLVNDRRFRHHPMILETPKGDANGKDMDVVNLQVLRGLVKSE